MALLSSTGFFPGSENRLLVSKWLLGFQSETDFQLL